MSGSSFSESISPTALEAIMSPSCKAKSPYVETVGIAKSLLIGHEREGEIILGAKKIGRRVGKYFVSKGYLADLEASVQFLTNEGNFPQTKHADRLSRRYKDEILPAQDSI